jgi:hypothetical protein
MYYALFRLSKNHTLLSVFMNCNRLSFSFLIHPVQFRNEHAVPGGVPGCAHPYVDHLDTSHQHALCVHNSICFTKEIFNIKMKMAVKEKEMPALSEG